MRFGLSSVSTAARLWWNTCLQQTPHCRFFHQQRLLAFNRSAAVLHTAASVQPVSATEAPLSSPSSSLSSSSSSSPSPSVELTDAAATRISELRLKHGPNMFLRLSIDSGGCSGLAYKFEIDKQGQQEDDSMFSHGNGGVLVDSVSLHHLQGAIIDYRSSIAKSGFEVIANPNAVGKCGCGTSFQPKQF